jgi:hypothetical protein
LFAALLLVAWQGLAEAHPVLSGKGPHNENGNTTLDLYRADNFNGAFNTAINNYLEVQNFGQAPRPRVVTSLYQADVIVRYNDSTETGAGFIHYAEPRIDTLRISRTGAYPVWLLTHELGHGYSMRDLTMEECSYITPDPATGFKSIMCHSRWESGDLTAHDREDLLLIPNKRVQ